MHHPTTIPLWFVYGLIEGKVIIDRIGHHEGRGLPTSLEINSLFREKRSAEALSILANLPIGIEVALEILREFSSPIHPSGRYIFIVGDNNSWLYPLLCVSYSQEFRYKILNDPTSILNVAILAKESEIPKEKGKGLIFPLKKETIQKNAALIALAYQFNAYGTAHIIHPLTPDEVLFSVEGYDKIEVSTDMNINNLWWFIAQRRALDYEFHKAVDAIDVDIHCREPIIQKINGSTLIYYPPPLLQVTFQGRKITSLLEELSVVCKRYHSKVALGIMNNEPYSSELTKLSKKMEKLKKQLQNERENLSRTNY